FDFGAPGLPSGGLRASAGALDVVQVILIGLVTAAVGVVLWRLLGARAAQAIALGRGPGPGPLDPARVADRAALIRAVEDGMSAQDGCPLRRDPSLRGERDGCHAHGFAWAWHPQTPALRSNTRGAAKQVFAFLILFLVPPTPAQTPGDQPPRRPIGEDTLLF